MRHAVLVLCLLTLAGSDVLASEPLRPMATRSQQLRALAMLRELPAVAAQAEALTEAHYALERAQETLWQQLLSQRGDADHAFRWTGENRTAVEAAKTVFRDAKTAYMMRSEALADAALESVELQARGQACREERAQCSEAWDAFICAPLLPVCLVTKE